MAFEKVRSSRAISLVLASGSASLIYALWLGISLGLVLSLAAAFPGLSQTQGKRKPPATKPPSHPVEDMPVPFRAGERLDYRVLWSKYSVNAATIQLQAIERGNFFNHAAWHFRALARTVDTMRILYPLDDQFESYTESARLTSVEYEMYLREQGKQQNNTWRMTVNGGASPPDATAAQVVPGTRDPVGLIYALRATDWTKTPEFRAPVFDGHHLYDIVARLEEISGRATVPAGQFTASHVAVRLFERGKELTDMHFSLWLASDVAHTPILIEADLPIGTARVELTTKPN
jgi:hypothetical protein